MPFNLRSQILRTFLIVSIADGLALLLRAAEPTPTVPPTSTAQALEGVWVYVGTPDDVRPAPRKGGSLKFRVSNHWTFTEANPVTGEVVQHFGGTYRVNGDEYTETIDYSTDPDDRELGATLKFTVKIEGDTMTQTGVGNPYTEVWKRVR